MNEKRKVPQFITRYANNKLGRLWNDKDRAEEVNERYRKVCYAVLDYEHGKIEIDDCMIAIANA